MMQRVKTWFEELTRVGKLSVVSAVALGGIFTASAMNPTPEPVPVQAVQEVKTVAPVVTTKIETETQPIAFTEETVKDGNLTKGVTQVRTEGVDGVKTITHTITLTDGVETARSTSEEVSSSPVTKVVTQGAYVAPVISAPSSSSGVVKKSRSDICHAPGTTYYSRTSNYTGFDSLQACLNSGGRMPLR